MQDTILDDVRGRMLEDIVLLETRHALGGDFEVFKLVVEGDQRKGVRGGEYDMVVRHAPENTVCLYEVKHSGEAVAEQARHLLDAGKIAMVEHAFGRVAARTVLYRGETREAHGVCYENVETYLRRMLSGIGA